MSKVWTGHCCKHMSPFNHSCGAGARYCTDENPCKERQQTLNQEKLLREARKAHGIKSNKWRTN